MICSGVFVRIKDKNLHVECFKCATCGTSLKNVGYYNINNKLYCDIHAKLVARQNPPAPNLEPVTIPPWVHSDTTASPPLMIKQCILLYVFHNYDVFTHGGALKSWLVICICIVFVFHESTITIKWDVEHVKSNTSNSVINVQNHARWFRVKYMMMFNTSRIKPVVLTTNTKIRLYSWVKTNQLDATYFIIYSILIQCSTCFGR